MPKITVKSEILDKIRDLLKTVSLYEKTTFDFP